MLVLIQRDGGRDLEGGTVELESLELLGLHLVVQYSIV